MTEQPGESSPAPLSADSVTAMSKPMTPEQQSELGKRMAEAMRQHLVVLAGPRWLREALELTQPQPEWRLHLREITSATDRRTSIASILPGRTASGHTAALYLTYFPEVRLTVSRMKQLRDARAAPEAHKARLL